MTNQSSGDIQDVIAALRSWWPWVRWAARRRLARLDLASLAARPALAALLAVCDDGRLRAVLAPALIQCLRGLTRAASELDQPEAAAMRRVLLRASPLREPALVSELLRAVDRLGDTGAVPAVREVIEKTTFRADDLAQYAAAPSWPPQVSAGREPADPELARRLRELNHAARGVMARLISASEARSRSDPLLRPAHAPSPPPDTLLRPARPADEADPGKLLRPAEGEER